MNFDYVFENNTGLNYETLLEIECQKIVVAQFKQALRQQQEEYQRQQEELKKH